MDKTITYQSTRLIKKAYILVAITCFCSVVNAQDLITLRTGEELKAVVSEVLTDQVKYKKFENKTGLTYTIEKDKVFMIKYENGTKDVFELQDKNRKSDAVVDSKKENPKKIKKQGFFSKYDYIYLHQEKTKTPVYTKKVMNMLSDLFVDLGLIVLTDDTADEQNIDKKSCSIVHCDVIHKQKNGFGDKLELSLQDCKGKTLYEKKVGATSFTSHDDETQLLVQKAFNKMLTELGY